MIDSITIERFKSIQRVELPLDNINVLVGANNSGKSSILQSIQFAISIAQTTSLEEFSSTKWKNNKLSTSLTLSQIIYAPLRDVYSLGYGGSLSQDRSKAIAVRFREKDTGELAHFLLRKGRNRNLLTEIEGKTLGNQIRNFENPYSIYVPGLAGIPASEELRSEGLIRRAAVKGDANNVFRNILWLLKRTPEKWNSFIADFKDIFPALSIGIAFDQLQDEHINAHIFNNNRKLPIDAYGTGILQIVQILSYVHLYNPKLLILDEPDSHLHPNNQRIIADKLSEITTRLNFQIILSTHSRHLLDAFENYASVKWIDQGNIREQEYSFINVLMEIGALDKADILNNGSIRCVVLTEDAKTKPLETILKSNDFNLSEIDIWPYNGCTKIDTAIVVAAFVKKHAPNTEILIHRDSDYLSTDELDSVKTKAEEAGIRFFFTKGTDIESHFIDSSHLIEIHPELSVEEINTLIDESTSDNEEKSLELFIDAAVAEARMKQYSGGAQVEPGKIATQCSKNYKAQKERYRHGKRVLKSLLNKLQRLHGQRNIFISTDHLRTSDLLELRNRIWPSEGNGKVVPPAKPRASEQPVTATEANTESPVPQL